MDSAKIKESSSIVELNTIEWNT